MLSVMPFAPSLAFQSSNRCVMDRVRNLYSSKLLSFNLRKAHELSYSMTLFAS